MSVAGGNLDRPRRSVRSYVLRGGRITPGQLRALEECWPAYGIDYSARPIDLAQHFGRVAALTVEVGFGNGEHLLHRALAEPSRNFLGVEVHRAGVGHLLARAAAAELRNLRVMTHDAVEVFALALPPGSVDEVQILFPDPWPKTRHHKRRLIQPAFIASVASRLKAGGALHLATDWEPYALEMAEILRAAPLLESASGLAPWAERPEQRALTRFEHRGLKRGHAVRELLSYRKRDT